MREFKWVDNLKEIRGDEQDRIRKWINPNEDLNDHLRRVAQVKTEVPGISTDDAVSLIVKRLMIKLF